VAGVVFCQRVDGDIVFKVDVGGGLSFEFAVDLAAAAGILLAWW
jgi:hypothetical protein